MIRFNCDYLEGAHPKILEKLIETNSNQSAGYGEDEYCDEARELIKKLCNSPESYVQFLVGGTQTNLTFLSYALLPYQGVIAADTGHIATHESGSVEATGHKVITLPHTNGKINAAQIDECCYLHFTDAAHEHMVMPGGVYISQSTEFGTTYTAKEISEINKVCKKWNLFLYLDGARLGYAMVSEGCDTDFEFLAHNTDAFYIGGTKQGALFGEALVINNPGLVKNFRYMIKQKGGMLAKGRLLGIQFTELLKDGLYLQLSRHAVDLAMKLRQALISLGVEFYIDSPTNQQFPILPDSVISAISEKYTYSYQCRVTENSSAIRFCTSWATKEEDVELLINDLTALLK